MKQYLQAIVDFLHAKKGVLGGLIAVITSYCAASGIISPNEALLVTGILGVLGIGADVATQKLGVSPELVKKEDKS